MFGRFWSWLTDNFGFLATKGFIITNFIGLSAALSFYFFLVRGDGLNAVTIGESIFVGVVTSGLGHFVGRFFWGDNWPGLHFGNFWEEVDQKHPKVEGLTESSGQEAVDAATRIMKESREARLRNRGIL